MSHEEDEYREINNELVVPAYRRFCEELDLPFHSVDKLPPELGLREDRLHPEAMNLFNRLKPELALFKGDVIWYQFTDWGGDFSYKRTPVDQFLEETADRLFYLEHLERRFEGLRSICVGAICCLAYAGVLWLVVATVPEQLVWLAGLLALGLPISLGLGLSRVIKRMPTRVIDDGRLKDVPERIRRLQAQLAEIRGDRPDPLRQQKHGDLLLSEPRESMSDEEIRRLVRKLRSRMFVVPRDES